MNLKEITQKILNNPKYKQTFQAQVNFNKRMGITETSPDTVNEQIKKDVLDYVCEQRDLMVETQGNGEYFAVPEETRQKYRKAKKQINREIPNIQEQVWKKLVGGEEQ